MNLNRKLNKAYADFMHFFWLPCPFPGCGEMFGGHEAGTYTYRNDPENPYMGKMVCKRHDGENKKEVEAAGYEYVPGMRILRVPNENRIAVEGAHPSKLHRLTPPE